MYCGHGAGAAFHGLQDTTTATTTATAAATTTTANSNALLPAAFLWGCSSGRLTSRGEHDPMGPVLSYLCHGAPYFVLGNLWDVTDRDLDRLTIEVIRQVFALKTNPSPPPTHAASALVSTKKVLFQDDDDDLDLDTNVNSNANSNSNSNSNAKSRSLSTTDAGVDLGSCLAFARDVCRMRYAVGAAAVVYGIPVPIALQE